MSDSALDLDHSKYILETDTCPACYKCYKFGSISFFLRKLKQKLRDKKLRLPSWEQAQQFAREHVLAEPEVHNYLLSGYYLSLFLVS